MPKGYGGPLVRAAVAAASAAAGAMRGGGKPPGGGGSKTKPKYRRKKYTSGTTTTTTRRTKETDVTQAEYSRRTTAIGRKPKQSLKQAWKLLNSNIASTVYGAAAYNQFAGATGTNRLLNTSTTTTTGTFIAPCHLWELTSAPNVINGVVTNPNVQWELTFTNPTSTGTVGWNNSSPLFVANADNVSTSFNTYPMGNDTLDWIKAKLLFYCPTTIPCRIQIDLVQLKDTRLLPDAANNSAFATAFWQSMVKRFAYSPMESGNTKYQKYLTVLHSQQFIMHPKESTENVNTTYKEVQIFKRMNRRCTYDWQDQDTMTMLGQETQQNAPALLSTQVHPRARIFLMIRAQANNAAAFDASKMPTYDYSINLKHSQFSS